MEGNGETGGADETVWRELLHCKLHRAGWVGHAQLEQCTYEDNGKKREEEAKKIGIVVA